MDRRYDFLKKITLFIVFFIVFIFALIASQDFLVPLLLGVLFSYLLFPIVKFLENYNFPRILAIIIALILAILVIILAVNFFSNQASVFAEDLPEIRQQATDNWFNMKDQLSSSLGISKNRIDSWETELTGVFETSDTFFRNVFDSTTSTIVQIGLMPVYIFFMLYYRSKFYDFIIKMVGNKREPQTKKMLSEINLVSKKYMTGVFIVVIILSIVHSIAFMIIGLDYPIFFGVTAALFNFIPYFGTLIGAVLPVLYAFLAMESTDYVTWVLLYFLIIQFVENNILTPNITGGYVHLNPFVTILTLIFGSMIWGVAGMFIIMPFMAMTKIFCQNVSHLKPVGFLLSDKGMEEHSLSWKKIKGFFSKDQ